MEPPRSLRSLPPAAATRTEASGPGSPGRLDPSALGRLKWRCRRGMLENDLFIERFFRRHEETITTRQAAGLEALMDLSDNDLLDLLLARSESADERPEVHEVLALLRRPAPTAIAKKGQA